MKNILLIVPLFLIVGCGVFDKKNLNDEKLLNDNEYVDYSDSNGSYDLADYLFPNKNQTNQYEVETINRDVKGKELARHKSNRNNKYLLIDDNRVDLGENISYFIQKNIIRKKEFINDFDDFKDYRRYLDKGDVYFSYEEIDLQDAYNQVGKLVCRLVEHNSTMSVFKTKYNDVLHLGCIGDFGEGTLEGFSKETFFNIEGFYAKNIGLIKQVSYRCEDTKYGTTNYAFCVDSTKSIQKIVE